MPEEANLDRVRGAVLNQIERQERNYKITFFAAALVESLFLLSFLWLADFSNRLHLLLLIATVATYTIIVLGLLALGAHFSRQVQLILKRLDEKNGG